jgi:hyperosmotically inducible protein
MMTDLKLRQDVLEGLDYEPSVSAAHIGVAVDKGVVILSGHVANYAEKTAAIAAVRQLKEARAIADEIEVRYPSDKKTADDEIAKRAIDILGWDITVPSGAIQVRIRDGLVTLSGSVDWFYQKKAAEEDVRKLSGVRGVINDIEIKPRVRAADVKRKIENALRRRTEIEANGLRVTIRDNSTVVLEGKVDNWDERHAVETAAWSAPGVTSVDDRLFTW